MKSPVRASVAVLAALLPLPLSAADQPPATRAVMVAYCQPTAQPPTIDGKLDDACWKDCQPLDNYVLDKADRLATQQTIARVCYDDQFVYFAFDCREDDMAHTKAVTRGRTVPWFEDSVEIFIDTAYKQQAYEQFGANLLGANNMKPPADSPGMVMAQGSRGDNGYVIELRIPLSALNQTGRLEGKTWGLNLTRNRYRDGAKEHSSWGRLRDSFHKPVEFGQLIFAPRPDVQVHSVQMNWKTTGLNCLELSVTNASAKPARVEIASGDSRGTATVPANGQEPVRCLIKLQPGLNRVPVTLRAGDQVLYQQDVPVVAVTAPPGTAEAAGLGSFRIVTDKAVYFQGEQLVAHAEAATAGSEPPRVTLTARIGDAAPQTAADGKELRLTVPQGPDGQISLTLQVTDAKGQSLLETTKVIPIRGVAKDGYDKQIAALEARLKALSFPAGSKLAKEIEYSNKKIARLKQLTSDMSDQSLRHIAFQIPELSYTLDTLEKGTLPVWGLRNRIYVSQIDDSEQGYVVVVPPSYVADDKAKLPVLIFLHGFIADAPWQPEGKVDPMQLACATNNVIAISPYGRGSTGYRYDGERDVWDVLEQVRRDYRVDEDRIYLGGFSMGGAGTMFLSNARPDLLAAMVACSCAPRTQQLPSLLHVPTWFFCGGQEDCVEPLKKAMETLLAQGTEAHFTSDPGSGHTTDFIDFDKLVPWLLEHRLVRSPKHIRFIATQNIHSNAYWATIDGFVDYGKPASIDITVEGQRIGIKAENLASLTLRPTADVLDLNKPVEVVLNGQPQQATITDGVLHVQCAAPTTKPADGGPAKGANVPSGPIAEIFARPFLTVYGTGADAQGNQAEAEAFVKGWNPGHHGTATVKADTALTDEIVRSHDIVVVGTPAKDSLAAQCVARLPMRLAADGIRVSEQQFAGTSLGVCVLGVNPLARDRHVLLVAGQTKEGVKLAREQLPNVQADFVIVEAGSADKPAVKAAGWFAADWRSVTLRSARDGNGRGR